jgi:hypothetical protein
MTINAAALRLLTYFSPEERSIPDAAAYPGCNAAVAGAMNGAFQRLFAGSGPWVRRDSRAALIYAPTAVTVAVTNGSTSATVTGWASWMAGCLIVIEGDETENRIKNDSASAVLKIPYGGTTGTKAATVWCDTVTIGTDVLEVHEPVSFKGAKLTPLPAAGIPASLITLNDYGTPSYTGFHEAERGLVASAGTPRFYSIDTWTKDAATPSGMRLSLSPLPSHAGHIEYETTLQPPVVSDLSLTTVLPIPLSLADSVFLPIATMMLFDSPFFRGVAVPQAITAKYQEALATIAKLDPVKHSPRLVIKG